MQMEKPSEYEAFDKTVKVIESCTTITQLKYAEQYIILFYDMFPHPYQSNEMYKYIERLNDKKREELNVDL